MFTRLVLRSACCIFSLLASSASAQSIDTVAGNGSPMNDGDQGVATERGVGQPFGVEIGPKGALFVTEVQNHRIRRVDLKTGRISTIAGNGEKGYAGDGGLAVEAAMNEPYEVRFDRAGNLFVVEMKNHIVRKIDHQSGRIETIAGTGSRGFGGDGGPADKARLNNPHSIALDLRGGLYIADIGNHRIRRVDLTTKRIETIAGNGQREMPTTGARAHGAAMIGPRALAIQDNVLWIALREGHSVWKLPLQTGILEHIAGSGRKGFADGGGDPLQAEFNGPKGIACDARGRIYVVDTENQAIRRIDPAQQKVATIAGVGPQARGYQGDDGPATKAWLDRPHGICLDAQGRVYIGDTNNHRVRRVK